MAETSKCATINIGQPQITITINSVEIQRDYVTVNTIYKGEDLIKYMFCANLTVSGGTPNLITMKIYLGKDQNSLVEVGSGSIPGYSGTFRMCLSKENILGCNTTDDLLKKAGVENLTSCAYCVKVIW